jgi:hypothetical protein
MNYQKPVYEKVTFNLEPLQASFYKSLKNMSHYLRWFTKQSKEYQDFLKEQKNENNVKEN